MQTIQVSNVKIASKPLSEANSDVVINNFLRRKKIESCSDPYGKYIPCQYHPLVEASHKAFDEHRPLVLSPDMIWLLIAQGVSLHVNANAEKLRSQFVNFNGRLMIEISRDQFIKDSRDNDWQGVFSEFSSKIKDSMQPGIYDKLVTFFSTTGTIEKAANEIVLLETVQNYFDCVMHTMCGIPFVIQEGTAEDWQLISEKTEELADWFGLDWWINEIAPIVAKMASSAAGKNEKDFWKSWYHLNDRSGGPYICGHISRFFPYLKNYDTGLFNRKVEEFQDGMGGLTTEQIPSGISSTKFLWHYYKKHYNMSFTAGFVGCTQNDAFAIKPKIGWAVVDEGEGIDEKFMRTCKICNEKKMIEKFSFSNNKCYKNPGIICNDCYYEVDSEKRDKVLGFKRNA
jgi:Domain of unknown function (DUF4419)